jgi:hypothetical protein
MTSPPPCGTKASQSTKRVHEALRIEPIRVHPTPWVVVGPEHVQHHVATSRQRGAEHILLMARAGRERRNERIMAAHLLTERFRGHRITGVDSCAPVRMLR